MGEAVSMDVLSPFKQSLRTHLGELADEWLGAKVKLVRNLSEAIAVERDPAKLRELHDQLKGAVISKADIDTFNELMTTFLNNAKAHAVLWVEIKRTMKATN